MKLITLISVFITLCDISSTGRVPRQSPQDRTMFSRYANSRFPFFTVDMARFQDKNPPVGKRSNVEDNHGNHKVELDEGLDEHITDDIAEAYGIFNARHVGDVNLISEEFTGYEKSPLPYVTPSIDKRSGIRKRIHTCAFMRRLGVPIGLCFSSMKKLNEENKNKMRKQQLMQTSRSTENRNPYEYLERQWQGPTMLGGGVGRR